MSNTARDTVDRWVALTGWADSPTLEQCRDEAYAALDALQARAEAAERAYNELAAGYDEMRLLAETGALVNAIPNGGALHKIDGVFVAVRNPFAPVAECGRAADAADAMRLAGIGSTTPVEETNVESKS